MIPTSRKGGRAKSSLDREEEKGVNVPPNGGQISPLDGGQNRAFRLLTGPLELEQLLLLVDVGPEGVEDGLAQFAGQDALHARLAAVRALLEAVGLHQLGLEFVPFEPGNKKGE